MAQYRYPDGTTGDSPWVRDASGNVVTNPDGSVTEGAFIGYNTPAQAMSIMGYGGGGSVGDVTTMPAPAPSPTPTPQPSGGAVWGGTSPTPAPALAPSGGAVWGGTSPTGTGSNNSPPLVNKPMQITPPAPSPSGGAVWGGTATNPQAPAGPSNPSGITAGIINSAITPWNVNSNQTVAGNIEQLLQTDSPLMQQARTRALQNMASRGIINSSLAVSAADASMYDAANAIAQADAATKAKAAGYNVDQLNQQVTLDKQLANQMTQAQLSAETSRYGTDVQARTAALNNESQRLIAQMGNDQQITLQRMQQENQRLLNTNQQAAAAFNNSMQYIDVINRDPNLDGPAKTRAVAQIYYNLQTQLRTLSQVSGVDVTGSLSLAGAPGFDDKGNYVGFDANGNTVGRAPAAGTPAPPPAPAPSASSGNDDRQITRG